MAGKRINPRTGSVLRGIESFHDSNGLRFDSSDLHSDVVRAYLVNSALTPSTLGTYRWVLTNALDLDLGVDLSFPGSKGARPYSDTERSDLVSIARSQKKAWRRSSALVLIAASIGAGVRAEELRYLKVEDLDVKNSAVTVGGRMVPIGDPWREILFSHGRAQNEFLFHPGAPVRDSKNLINGFASDLTRDPNSPRFQMARGRSSFICDRWNEGVSPTELLRIAGIREVESLIRYVHLLKTAPRTKAGLRDLLASRNP